MIETKINPQIRLTLTTLVIITLISLFLFLRLLLAGDESVVPWILLIVFIAGVIVNLLLHFAVSSSMQKQDKVDKTEAESISTDPGKVTRLALIFGGVLGVGIIGVLPIESFFLHLILLVAFGFAINFITRKDPILSAISPTVFYLLPFWKKSFKLYKIGDVIKDKYYFDA